MELAIKEKPINAANNFSIISRDSYPKGWDATKNNLSENIKGKNMKPDFVHWYARINFIKVFKSVPLSFFTISKFLQAF